MDGIKDNRLVYEDGLLLVNIKQCKDLCEKVLDTVNMLITQVSNIVCDSIENSSCKDCKIAVNILCCLNDASDDVKNRYNEMTSIYNSLLETVKTRNTVLARLVAENNQLLADKNNMITKSNLSYVINSINSHMDSTLSTIVTANNNRNFSFDNNINKNGCENSSLTELKENIDIYTKSINELLRLVSDNVKALSTSQYMKSISDGDVIINRVGENSPRYKHSVETSTLVDMYNSGKSCEDISKALGGIMTSVQIRNRLKQAGVFRRWRKDE